MKKAEQANTLIVTHTFLLKIIETYIKFPDLFIHPEKLGRNFDVNKRLVNYCKILSFEKAIKQSLNKEKRGF